MRTVPDSVLAMLQSDLLAARITKLVPWRSHFLMAELSYYLGQNDYVNARNLINSQRQLRDHITGEVSRHIAVQQMDEKLPGSRFTATAPMDILSTPLSAALLATSWPIAAGQDKVGSYISLADTSPKSRSELCSGLLAAGPWPMQFLSPSSWHITLCYSQGVVLPPDAGKLCTEHPVSSPIDRLETWRDHKGRAMLVAIFSDASAPALMHQKWLEAGATHTYLPYCPHVSLAYDPSCEIDTSDEGRAKLFAFNYMLQHTPLHLTFHRESVEALK